MRNLFRHLADAPCRLGAIAAAATIMTSTEAYAVAGGIGQVADNVKSNFQQLGNFIIASGFLGGVGLSGAGLMKLKAASDDGGQRVKYSEGLWRLGIGGCLCALPAVTGTGLGTFFGSADDNAVPMGTASFTN